MVVVPHLIRSMECLASSIGSIKTFQNDQFYKDRWSLIIRAENQCENDSGTFFLNTRLAVSRSRINYASKLIYFCFFFFCRWYISVSIEREGERENKLILNFSNVLLAEYQPLANGSMSETGEKMTMLVIQRSSSSPVRYQQKLATELY